MFTDLKTLDLRLGIIGCKDQTGDRQAVSRNVTFTYKSELTIKVNPTECTESELGYDPQSDVLTCELSLALANNGPTRTDKRVDFTMWIPEEHDLIYHDSSSSITCHMDSYSPVDGTDLCPQYDEPIVKQLKEYNCTIDKGNNVLFMYVSILKGLVYRKWIIRSWLFLDIFRAQVCQEILGG